MNETEPADEPRQYTDRINPTTLLQCEECGAIVGDRGAHDLWHDYPEWIAQRGD